MNAENNSERRDRFRKGDVVLKAILLLIGTILGMLGWGMREIYTNLVAHDRQIVALEQRVANSDKMLAIIEGRQTVNNDTINMLVERSSNIDKTIQIIQTNTTIRLDRIEGKIDQIINREIDGHRMRGGSR